MRGLQAAEPIWGQSLGYQQQLGSTREKFGGVSGKHCHHWQGANSVRERIGSRTRLVSGVGISSAVPRRCVWEGTWYKIS